MDDIIMNYWEEKMALVLNMHIAGVDTAQYRVLKKLEEDIQDFSEELKLKAKFTIYPSCVRIKFRQQYAWIIEQKVLIAKKLLYVQQNEQVLLYED